MQLSARVNFGVGYARQLTSRLSPDGHRLVWQCSFPICFANRSVQYAEHLFSGFFFHHVHSVYPSVQLFRGLPCGRGGALFSPAGHCHSISEQGVVLVARKPKRDLTVEEQLARGPLDLPFLMLTMLLLGVGLIMMFSASFATAYYNDGDPLVYIKNQAVYAAAGVVVMFLVSKINYQTFRLLSVPGIVAAILLLVLALSPLGVELNEVKRWVRIGPIQFQPSEVAKVAVTDTIVRL